MATTTFTSATTQKVYNLTRDCTFLFLTLTGTHLTFTSGEFTINGNGFTIFAASPNPLIEVSGVGAVLNLNDVSINQPGGGVSQLVYVRSGARLNAEDLTFQYTSVQPTMRVDGIGTEVHLTDSRFLDNGRRGTGVVDEDIGSALTVTGGARVVITRGAFARNDGQGGVIRVISGASTVSTLELIGRVAFSGNTNAAGRSARDVRPDANVIFRDGRPKEKKKTPTPRPTETPRPLATTCIDLNEASGIVVSATYGLASGIQCQRLGGGGIGVQSLAENFIDAVDVWGYVVQGVQVCFPQAGRIIFLDAQTMPRTAAALESQIVDGMTCVSIASPGSLVLLPDG